MNTRLQFLLLGFLLAGCSAQHEPMDTKSLQGFDSASFFSLLAKSHKDSLTHQSSSFSSEDFNKSLRVVSSTLLGRAPLNSELLAANEGFPEYHARIEAMVNAPETIESFRDYFHLLFNMSGEDEGINYEEPTNLALYLISNDIDFRQILLADYCVTNNLMKGPCSAFPNETVTKAQAAGVITTRAFLAKWAAAFNFQRTAKAFELFACSQYPDSTDAGLPPEKISNSVKTFDCQDCQPACYSCHKSMNSRAYLFYDFTVSGKFDLSPSKSEMTKTDTGAASTRLDVLKQGVTPEYHGKPLNKVQDYARYLAKSRKFRDCFSKRMVNFMTGVAPNAEMNLEFESIRNQFSWNGYQIRKTLVDIATHPSFIRKARPL